MGIQINGTNDSISAADGSLTVLGTELKDLSQLNVTGVATAASLVVSGNASIGGTITYMDVSNVDSVGIITAQQGIQVLANGLDVTGVSTFKSNVRVNSGTVGVNTTAVDAQLEVHAAASKINAATIKTSAGAGGYAGLAFMAGQTTAGREKAAIYFQETNGGAHYTGDIVFALNNDNGSAVQVGTSDERVRITSSGRIGIGTNNPGRLFQVFNASTNPQVNIKAAPGGTCELQFGDTADDVRGNIVYNCTDDYLSLHGYNNAERLRITSAGNVGLSVTNPDLKLHVNGTNALPSSSGSTPTGHLTLRNKQALSSHGMFMGVSDAAPYGSWIQAQDANNNATNYPLLLNPNGGNVGIATASPGARLHVYGNAVGFVNTLTDGATITPDFSSANNFTVTLGGTRTLANPTGLVPGQSGFISIVQDGTGSRTLSWGSYWDFPSATPPTLTTTANGVDVVAYYVRTTTSIAADTIIGIGTL